MNNLEQIQEAAPARQSYSKPQLKTLGHATDLTQGTTAAAVQDTLIVGSQ